MKPAAAAVLMAAAILPSCGHGDTENKANVEQPAPTVIVATVRQGTVPITEDFQGTIGAVESVEIRARVPGVLEQAPFKEGDLVRRGDLIFQIQQNEYVAALRTAQAQLGTGRAQAGQARGNLFSREAALARANTTVARDRPLAADKAIPQKDLDNAIQNAEIARGDVDVARAQIESASAATLAGQAAVDNAQINLGYTTIRAPVTGLIGFLNYDVGNVVGGPGIQVLDTISTIDPVKITFGLDEPTYLALARTRGTESGTSLRGQPLQVVLANDATYPYAGSVYAISPTIDPKTGTVTVESRFPNPDGLLRPGGFARVRVTVERRRDAVLVPQTAIVKSQGVDTVYVIDSKNVAALRTVTLGPQYQQSFIVQSGLRAGERVVVEGTQKVRPDAKVVVKAE
ncbi:MAG TPA: efflux RND transporter periplasmic adaptor subunit [Candidatus Acidoferrales bacterium]|jgi:RND family efflux transporter MFP subunit|nr:efflux RND transporter periplasmic adaptor subunit [Candidatus Acidoferrales bacterium]